MIAFLDTEFTGLGRHSQLLSVGIAVGAGDDERCEFYAESNEPARLLAASSFTREAVLPQFGNVPHAACSYGALGRRLATFLSSLSDTLASDGVVDMAFESDRDWELVTGAIKDAGGGRWARLVHRLRPVNIYNIAGFAAGARAAAAYFDAQHGAAFSRHHALCDARALRIAYEAANATTAASADRRESSSLHHEPVRPALSWPPLVSQGV